MRRLDYWKARLKVAQVEQNYRKKELSQMERAFERAVEQVKQIEEKVNDETSKLARAER